MPNQPSAQNSLSQEEASRYAQQALHAITCEYPNAPAQVINSPGDIKSPRTLHPAFYGCFDWHSSVHSHWLLIRVLRLFPDLAEGQAIRTALNTTLTPSNILVESGYFDQPNNKAFERMYGWGWVLKLAAELLEWNDLDGVIWSESLKPLTQTIIALFKNFLPRLTYPVRVGTHTNTAFSLILALDYAWKSSNKELEELLVKQSLAYFLEDKDNPADWEPGGGDFLSPALIEADLMSRILSPAEFNDWFDTFLPGIEKGEPKVLLNPVIVSDLNDPSLGHLIGLQLSRAWCMQKIAKTLPAQAQARPILEQAAAWHAQAGLAHVITEDYMRGHWLASFALYLKTIDLS